MNRAITSRALLMLTAVVLALLPLNQGCRFIQLIEAPERTVEYVQEL